VRVTVADCEAIFRAQEPKKRMRDQAAHACRALCRARVAEELPQILRRLAEIEHTPASQLTASELGPIYNPVSEYTDVQRENETKAIIGQIVDWTLPVYDVTKTAPNIYRIQTEAKEGFVATIATVNTRSDLERDYVERLKWGSLIHIKGRITGVRAFVRHLTLDDAIVFAPASEPHVSEVR
jgi:hypothetical protein